MENDDWFFGAVMMRGLAALPGFQQGTCWDLYQVAWMLAASLEASVQNGARAVELAEQVIRLTGGADPLFVHTLAAAYAGGRAIFRSSGDRPHGHYRWRSPKTTSNW